MEPCRSVVREDRPRNDRELLPLSSSKDVSKAFGDDFC